jgi:hypothetical protein
MRTLVACWTLMAQQFIGLGIFFAYVTYFFQQAGIQDPFKVACITSGINIFFSLVIIYVDDIAGRRILACSGTTIYWVCTVAVGILGVVPANDATNKLLVFFTVITYPRSVLQIPTPRGRHRPCGQRRNRMGVRRRDLLPTTSSIYGWLCCSFAWSYLRRTDPIYGQRQRVELGSRDELILCGTRLSIYLCHVVPYS